MRASRERRISAYPSVLLRGDRRQLLVLHHQSLRAGRSPLTPDRQLVPHPVRRCLSSVDVDRQQELRREADGPHGLPLFPRELIDGTPTAMLERGLDRLRREVREQGERFQDIGLPRAVRADERRERRKVDREISERLEAVDLQPSDHPAILPRVGGAAEQRRRMGGVPLRR
jgi:hypothetical protein